MAGDEVLKKWASAALWGCRLTQVLHNVLGLIILCKRDGLSRKRQDSRERERQSEVHWSLDLLLHVEVNGKEQALSPQLLPSLCVSY